MPLEQVLVRYYQQHACMLASAEFARIAMGLWSDFFAGAMVQEATPAKQREFIEWLRSGGKRPRSDGYIKRIMTVGKAALTRAYKEGEITSAPFVIPGEDGPSAELVLTKAQSEALWSSAKLPHERAFLALAYCTLSRPEAILDLRGEFVDHQRWLFNTNPPGRVQTRKFRPVVPVCEFLRPWLTEARSGALVAWRGEPIGSFKTAWRGLRRRAGLPSNAVAKTIRHTMATELRAADVPEAEISGFLGHRAYKGKTETYAKYRPGYLGKAAGVIDGYMDELRVTSVLK